MERVWFDFGNGPLVHEEESKEAMDAFIEGVQFSMQANGLDDFRQFNTQAELDEYLAQEEE
jgi:hypothetical protein